jgi:starvation-inducible DNA-binding protein
MEKHFHSVLNTPVPLMHENESPLGSKQVAGDLSDLLVATRALSRQSLYCHWQMMEYDSSQLHSLFEQHYQSARKAVDIIADRIRTLGYELPDRFSQSVWGTGEDDGRPLAEMIALLIRKHQYCAYEAKKVLTIAEMAGDDISANLAAQRLAAHEKAAWLLSLFVEN